MLYLKYLFLIILHTNVGIFTSLNIFSYIKNLFSKLNLLCLRILENISLQFRVFVNLHTRYCINILNFLMLSHLRHFCIRMYVRTDSVVIQHKEINQFFLSLSLSLSVSKMKFSIFFIKNGLKMKYID